MKRKVPWLFSVKEIGGYTTQSCGDSQKKTLSESLSNKQDSMESSFFSWLKSASRLQADRRKSAKKKKHKKDKAVREMVRKSCSVLPITLLKFNMEPENGTLE